MFFLDASPEELSKRIEGRSEREMFETLEDFADVRRKALSLVKDWNIIDASGSIDDTFSKIETVLNHLD